MKNTTLFIVSFLATLLVISSAPAYLYLNNIQDSEPWNPEGSEPVLLSKFSSHQELTTYLETSSSLPYNYWLRAGGRGAVMMEGGSFSVTTTVPEPAPSVPMEPTKSDDVDYSETNIQVAGVDEADIIKTDDEYIYIVSGGNVTIVKAYPPNETRVLSKISLNGNIMGIFINDNRLIIFENDYMYYGWLTRSAEDLTLSMRYEPPETCIKVYDVSDRENPVLKRDFSVDG